MSALAAQDGTYLAARLGHGGVPGSGRLLVGEGPVRGAEAQPVGERLVPGRDLLPGIGVEQPDVLEQPGVVAVVQHDVGVRRKKRDIVNLPARSHPFAKNAKGWGTGNLSGRAM